MVFYTICYCMRSMCVWSWWISQILGRLEGASNDGNTKAEILDYMSQTIKNYVTPSQSINTHHFLTCFVITGWVQWLGVDGLFKLWVGEVEQPIVVTQRKQIHNYMSHLIKNCISSIIKVKSHYVFIESSTKLLAWGLGLYGVVKLRFLEEEWTITVMWQKYCYYVSLGENLCNFYNNGLISALFFRIWHYLTSTIIGSWQIILIVAWGAGMVDCTNAVKRWHHVKNCVITRHINRFLHFLPNLQLTYLH